MTRKNVISQIVVIKCIIAFVIGKDDGVRYSTGGYDASKDSAISQICIKIKDINTVARKSCKYKRSVDLMENKNESKNISYFQKNLFN